MEQLTVRVAPVIEQHHATFQSLVARAEAYLLDGRLAEAASFAQIAAGYAVNRHPGLFTSGTLERLLLAIGRRGGSGRDPRSTVSRTAGMPEHVLHVFTQVVPIGGHTRMAWRWIEQDAERRHSIAITRQGATPVPERIHDAVDGAHGRLHVLDQARSNLLTRAARLRGIAAGVDLVVLHTHQDDVVPSIAFADKTSLPPVCFLNHADHVFWLGTAVSDIVASQRDSGRRLAVERRGVEPERCGMLPIIVPPTQRRIERLEAKRRLGLPEDSVVLLSIARFNKYLLMEATGTGIDDVYFPQVVEPVLDRHPQAMLLVVGPDHIGEYERAGLSTGGRVRAFGARDDPDIFYQAADIYLDSFPWTSITSLLEAGSYGVPLVSCFPYPPSAAVLGSDTPALDRCLIRVHGKDEYAATLHDLIVDRERRQRAGDVARQAIVDTHQGAGWTAYLRAMYESARERVPSTYPGDATDARRVDEIDALVCCMFASQPDLDVIIGHQLRLMPIELRARLWVETMRSRRAFLPGLLLPDWLATRLEMRHYSSRAGRRAATNA